MHEKLLTWILCFLLGGYLFFKGSLISDVTGQGGDEEMKQGVHRGRYCLVFFTPELLITSTRWWKVLTSDIYNARLMAFVVDEAHCVKKW